MNQTEGFKDFKRFGSGRPHLTSLSVDSVDGHLLLCELSSSSLPPSTPRVAASNVTGVRADPWSASGPCSFRTLFRALCYRHRDRSFAKLNMERDESADNRRARVVLLEHAPCGSSVCVLQERKRSREVVPRLATVRKHISGEQTDFIVNTEPATCIVSPYQILSAVCVDFFAASSDFCQFRNVTNFLLCVITWVTCDHIWAAARSAPAVPEQPPSSTDFCIVLKCWHRIYRNKLLKQTGMVKW